MGTELDILVCGNAVLSKSAQDPALKLDYKTQYALD
jgi:carbamoyltransferase